MTYANRAPFSAPISSAEISPGLKPYTFDILSWIQSHPGQRVSFALQMNSLGTQRHFYRSREYGGSAPTAGQLADRPKIIISVGVPDTPGTTQNPLTATAGNGSVTLNWPAVDATSYTVYRGTASGALSVYATNIATNTYVDTAVVNGTQYFYHIVATNNSGDSLPSN